ncbi:hypothetical protein ACKE5C_16285 [Aneurinibacillus thermoaerophilus]|nr:hypothetical protein [Aneurinibacillus sp. XH2]
MKPFWRRWWFWLVIILFIAVNLAVNSFSSTDKERKGPTAEQSIETH